VQIHCIFVLPAVALRLWFPRQDHPSHLAYVDWFTLFSFLRPGRDHGLYKVSQRIIDGKQHSSIIPISLVHQSAHLLPAFGPVAPVKWTLSTVLEMAPGFYVNSFTDRFSYSMIC